MDGILNVLKPAGMTSFDVIAHLRRIYGQKKIGHGGTLDPMAAGVLPVFLGRAARLIEYAPINRKKYEAEFIMGIATDTEDMTGRVISESAVNTDTSDWERAMSKYRGEIEQVPSAYSAVSVNGRRAYALAREGKKIEIPPRKVTIFHLDLREINSPYVRLSADCSSGTYIRALGRDLGAELGIAVTMSFLLRTEMGPFTIDESKTLEEIEKDPEGCLVRDIRPIISTLLPVHLNEKQAKDFSMGKRIAVKENDESSVAVFNNDVFLGTASIEEGILHPKKVFL